MNISQIKEMLMQNHLMYRPLLNLRSDQQNIPVIEVNDNANMRQLLFGSLSSKNTASVSKSKLPTSLVVLENGTTIDRDEDKTMPVGPKLRCPVCFRDYKNYPLHKYHRIDGQCCICKETTFENESTLSEHKDKFARKNICCVCKKNYLDDQEEFHKHTDKCKYYKNKKKTKPMEK